MGLFSSTWQAVTGKVSATGMFGKSFMGLWDDKQIDYTRNDYDLYRSIYYGVSIGGKAKDMQGGSMFAKPIVNSSAGFILGQNFSVSISEDKFADTQQSLNDWVDQNQSLILSYVIHGLRDGDSYIYIDEYGNAEELDANTVTAVLDPMTGDIIGYDVEEKYTLSAPGAQDKKMLVVKNYRTNSVKYTQYEDNQTSTDKLTGGKVIYNKVYTVDGAINPVENQIFYKEQLVERPLPVIHFANDVEPRQIYGNSELLNCLIGIRNYTAVLSNATKGVINNSNPIPVLTGVKNAEAVARQSNTGETEDRDKVSWNPETILFLENPEAKAEYIQANGFMDDTGKLLEYYFMLIVEGSETPEFVFGNAVNSSRASVSEQMPVVVQKAIRKRAQLLKPFTQLLESYIDRRIRMSDTVYLPLKNSEYTLDIEFPDIVDEDKNLTLSTVQFLTQAGIISDETALKLLLSDKINDPAEELQNAREDNDTRAKETGAVPTEPNRLQNEINANNQPANKPKEKVTNEPKNNSTK